MNQLCHLNYYLTQTFLFMKSLSLGGTFSSKIQRNGSSLFPLIILTALFLSACLHLNARNINQHVSLSFKEAPLTEVFTEIRKQTGYDFLFKSDWLKSARAVNIEVKNSTVPDVLVIIFKGQPLTYQIVNKTVIIRPKINTEASVASENEPIDVKGKVLNEKGEPISGVTVSIKGTSIITSTDNAGEFILTSVERNAVIVFNSVNTEPFELRIGGKKELLVNLKPKITELGDVVVTINTGYQHIPKDRVTGSFSYIDNKTFNQQVGTNILKRLDGVTSGLYFNVGKSGSSTGPNPTTGISIRGLSTINGPLDPLIVLDNFIYEGDINNINPNDIESITILKDAAAASIWGARAGNGVIVINTKKGGGNQKTRVEFNSNIIVSEKPDLYYLPQVSSSDYINMEEFIFNKGYFDSQIDDIFYRPALTPAVDLFLRRKNGEISAEDSASQINALKQIDSRDQYNKYFYKRGIIQQYSLNLRGGNNTISWLASGAYEKNTGNLKNEYDKLNLRFTNTYKPGKNFQIEVGGYYTNSKAKDGLRNNFRINGRTVPYLKFADENGNALNINEIYRIGYIDTVGAGKLLDWKYYPLEDYKHDRATTNLQEILANLSLNYQILNSLRLSVNYQYQKQWKTTERLADLQSFYTRDLINNFTQVNYSTGNVTYIIPKGSILSYSNSSLSTQNIRGQLSYNKSWGDHSVSAIAGGEVRELINDGNSFRYYGYSEDPLTYSSVDYNTRYPTYVPGNLQNIPSPPYLSSTVTNRFVSLYSNASYTFKQRYTLSASARRDASNIFGLSTNDKWNPLWSTGAGWDISKEAFYKLSWLPFLKLRTTIGFSGNVDVNKSPLPVANYLVDGITSFPIGRINAPANPLLRWEKSRQINIGVDFALKNQRITGTIEYYTKKGSDLYGETSYDYTTWGRSAQITKNIANMKGSGIDVLLSSKNIDGPIRWTTNLIYNFNTNKTTAYYTTTAHNIFTLISSGDAITPVVGKPLYAIGAYKWAGLNASGDPLGLLDGKPSSDYLAINTEASAKGEESAAITYIGPANPTHFGSIINEFTWKGITASINFSYKFGYYFRKPVFTSTSFINLGLGHADFTKRWQQPGDELTTNVPAFVYTDYPQFGDRDIFYQFSEINVLKGDHIRIQYVNLSYSLFEEKYKKQPFEQLSVYLNVSNLGIIWRSNKEGIDPDYPSSLPPVKTFAIGLKASF